MPVRKFRSAEEMNRPIWRSPGDPDLYAVIAGLWDAGARVRPRRFPPGGHRYRSIGELQAAVDAWDRRPPRSP